MRAMYLNGEKVYVERIKDLKPGNKWSGFNDNIQIVKHKEIVRALNCIFEYVEENPDKIGDDLSKIIYDLNLLSDEESPQNTCGY